LPAPPSRTEVIWSGRSRRKRRLRIIFPLVTPLMLYAPRVEDGRLRIEYKGSHLLTSIFNRQSSILDSRLSGLPLRIALGDGDEYEENQENDEPSGRDSAANAAEKKKVEKGTKRLGAGVVEK